MILILSILALYKNPRIFQYPVGIGKNSVLNKPYASSHLPTSDDSRPVVISGRIPKSDRFNNTQINLEFHHASCKQSKKAGCPE